MISILSRRGRVLKDWVTRNIWHENKMRGIRTTQRGFKNSSFNKLMNSYAYGTFFFAIQMILHEQRIHWGSVIPRFWRGFFDAQFTTRILSRNTDSKTKKLSSGISRFIHRLMSMETGAQSRQSSTYKRIWPRNFHQPTRRAGENTLAFISYLSSVFTTFTESLTHMIPAVVDVVETYGVHSTFHRCLSNFHLAINRRSFSINSSST